MLAVGLPAIAIVLWALWAAPRAGKRRLKMPALLVFKVCDFRRRVGRLVGGGAGVHRQRSSCALVAINVLGMWAFRQY